jgi:hypothetical protein
MNMNSKNQVGLVVFAWDGCWLMKSACVVNNLVNFAAGRKADISEHLLMAVFHILTIVMDKLTYIYDINR